VLLEQSVHRMQDRAGEPGEGLPRNHNCEISIRGNAEQVEHARAHVGVLTGIAHGDVDFRTLAGGQHHGREFDGLRPRSENDEQAYLVFIRQGMLSV
jgi:hypothetical protein